MYELFVAHNSRYYSQFVTYFSLLTTYNSPPTTHYLIFQLNTHNSLPIINKDSVLCFAPFPSSSKKSISMWLDESQIVLLSVACVSFVSSLFCLISTTQMHATHTTPLQSTREKNIFTHNSLFTAHYSILNAHCQVLSAHQSLLHYSLLTTHTQSTITHCSQLTHNAHNSQFTIHNSLLTTNDDNVLCFTPFHLFDQHVVTWWIASFSSACRVCFVCFFTVLPHLDNTSASHIHTTPSPINAWKKTSYVQLTNHCFLLTI